jgi:diguanylate cyclase with GGDEF domain/PucR-like helix-turn-helix protein
MRAAKVPCTTPPGLAAGSGGEARASLHTRLQERRGELEQAILTRAYGVSDPGETADPEYVEGLRAAVGAAIEYGLAGIEDTGGKPPEVPATLLVQARIAARNGIGLDTVLRRYFAGYALLGDFVLEEAQQGGLLQGAPLKGLLGAQATLFDRLLAAVSEEHAREWEGRPGSAEERRAELIDRLLAGERLDTVELAYDFEAIHLGAVAKGPGAMEAIRDLAKALDRRLLAVRRQEGTVWAWLGGRRPVDPEELERHVSQTLPPAVSLALGEPGEGPEGWHLTHRQARAALPIALRGPRAFTRYADVALLASVLQDDLLATSLRELYLTPLGEDRDGGEVARETLRAYFAADRNSASAAAALGVTRQTVNNRLRTIEERLGRPLNACALELTTALRLEELDPAKPELGGHRQASPADFPAAK